MKTVLAGLARRGRRLAGLHRRPRLREQVSWLEDGLAFARRWPRTTSGGPPAIEDNPLRSFFEGRRRGRGIWKWSHYFDAYHRHLSRFRGREIFVVEIGVYSGGSLEMWQEYFGPHCHIYGVDIEDACKRYEGGAIRIVIGDQADREFWRRFREDVPRLDVVIDDGGHEPIQQRVTVEELLPHLQAGGVYICEDIHGWKNEFGSYVAGLAQAMNAADLSVDMDDPERRVAARASGFQSLIDSIHVYPFLTVIEKRESPVIELVAPRRGSDWAPFLQ